MELRQLRYFVTVAEQRHFGRAAEQLHIVQPAVSQQIARLERELGLMLFDRSHRQITLTADGEAFLPHARQVLGAVDRATRAAGELAAGAGGLLRVGSSEVLGPRLRDILAAFALHRPGARVDLLAGHTPDKLASVAAGELDAAFVRAADPTAGVTVHPLWDEPLAAAVVGRRAPPGDSPIDLAALADLPLSRADRAVNPGVFDLITAGCRAAGFTPLPGPAFRSVQDILAGPIAADRCWTLLYAATPPGAIPDGVALRPTRPAVLVPTGLAVTAHRARPLAGDLLTIARATAGARSP